MGNPVFNHTQEHIKPRNPESTEGKEETQEQKNFSIVEQIPSKAEAVIPISIGELEESQTT